MYELLVSCILVVFDLITIFTPFTNRKSNKLGNLAKILRSRNPA